MKRKLAMRRALLMTLLTQNQKLVRISAESMRSLTRTTVALQAAWSKCPKDSHLPISPAAGQFFVRFLSHRAETEKACSAGHRAASRLKDTILLCSRAAEWKPVENDV